MTDIVELGGNISLEGFSDLERAKLIVVKKIVGNYAKAIEGNYEKLRVSLAKEGDDYKVIVAVKGKESEQNAESLDKNLFMALDSAFKKIA